ncbi:hypothetical protein HNQ93_000580 [Hymenobacter luteus]|uniref:DUF6970 domain-containing protein n=2 Tax=Hymenobacter TaxID=89966 RepID=A0A7W9SYK1_9BACT|nr:MULTISPECIES: hypothetical protein [Hymenobacter]MBB4599940.1 hypothetical protein [Hymenobacter latericoloratus]MBB6057750.1 hypothetical protein [Hymenobacter luteus]
MSRLRLRFLLWLFLLGLGATACSDALDEATSATCPGNFSATLIEELKQKPKQTPAAEVIQYTYQNRTVYLVTGGSSFNYLFDACGNVLCAATLGPSNAGDGRCPDFATAATDPRVLWRDPR